MGRIREFNTELVLQQTMNLFWKQGYQATSLEDLMKETKLNKQSLYTAFGDKRSLFVQGLELYVQTMLDEIENKIVNKKSPLKALSKALSELSDPDESAHPKGCLASRTASEFGAKDEEISKILESFHSRAEKLIEKSLLEAEAFGEIDNSIPAAEVAKLIMMSITGSRVLQQNGATKKELRLAFSTLIKLIEKK